MAEPINSVGMLILAVLATAIILFVAKMIGRNKKAMIQQVAESLGLVYHVRPTQEDLAPLVDVIPGLLNQKKAKRHYLHGEYEGFPICAVQVGPKDDELELQSLDYVNVYAFTLPKTFPALQILPARDEGLLAKILAPNITLDSVEFSEAYVVRCDEQKFAYDFCNTQMMEYLLEESNLTLCIQDNHLILMCKGRMLPGFIKTALDRLTDVRVLMPEFLLE